MVESRLIQSIEKISNKVSSMSIEESESVPSKKTDVSDQIHICTAVVGNSYSVEYNLTESLIDWPYLHRPNLMLNRNDVITASFT